MCNAEKTSDHCSLAAIFAFITFISALMCCTGLARADILQDRLCH